MTHPSSFRWSTRACWLGAASLMLATSFVTTSARVHEQAEAQEPDIAATGVQTTEAVCTSCHGLEEVTMLRRTPSDWSDLVNDMAARGADGTEAQLALIRQYLTRYYGMAAVNTATARELSAVLGLTAKDADAIVAYRRGKGKFASVDALLKVPGVDASKIKAQPDALTFD